MMELQNRRNNVVKVCGIIDDEFEFNHSVLSEKFYETKIKVERRSGNLDVIPIVAEEYLIKTFKGEPLKGKFAEVTGEIRTYNYLGDDSKNHLKMFLFVLSIEVYENKQKIESEKTTNSIYLNGYITKTPIYRTNLLSGREITELMIAVNRPYNKSSYIPCIAWNKLAVYASKFNVGDEVRLTGRIQSRDYIKKEIETGTAKKKTTYEVSIISLEKV